MVLACVDFLRSTKLCCVNGAGVSLTRGILSGERLFVVSSAKAMGVGVLVTSMGVLGWVCGRKSEKNGPS